MNKSELLNWLQAEQRQWEALLDQIDPAEMDQPGVAGEWSMKDIIAHLTEWDRHQVARFQAAQRSMSEPAPPWPEHLQTDDEINAWIYESKHEAPVRVIREESQQVFQQLWATVEALPDDVRIETIQASPDRTYYRVWLGDTPFQVGESFDHFRDDHEAEVRAWLEKLNDQ